MLRVIQAPPRDFEKAQRLITNIALDGFDHHLHHCDVPPTEESVNATLLAMLRLCYQAGALWRDSFPDDEMHLELR